MKRIIFLAFAFLSAMGIAMAQQHDAIRAKSVIADRQLEITWHKTTLLLFPAPIQDGSRGDKTILAERVEGVENALKVKAAERGFPQSNLHVVTTDGKVYAFTVNYNEYPSEFTIDMGTQPSHSPATFEGISLNSRELELRAATIKGIPPFVRKVRQSRFGMELRLEGIFVKDDVLFFRYSLSNQAQIKYDPASLRFYVRDKKRAKRTAVQDTEMQPVFVQHSGNIESSKGQTIIVAFPKFTIAESKYFVTELMEQGGDRNLACKIDQGKLLQAKTID
ncbi:MAG: conjugative transposon protein TraN [Bacteroidetes bacterium 43-16]|uniref:conjugative transposon protein TraN n=1 Tax=uncultured Dysgonomonas sp. TaxID=206096 RepID=UPI00092ABC38|nr:conjugative transposon protein TraN [uncultured Dysgonomonas sp.]OJV52285.1 MAG: conjugative transposon protein TraN [Bacteroidetes bacterium 43-16]